MHQSRLVAPAAIGLLFALAACQSDVKTPATAVSPTAAPPARTAAPAPQPIAVLGCSSRSVTWDGSSPIDLTGTWAGDDAGVYYIRQLGDQVWWLGMSGLDQPLIDRGTDFSNVYLGTLSGDTITGTYADVPQGKILDQGPVVLKLTPTASGGISLVRTDPVLATGFGGTSFTPCELA